MYYYTGILFVVLRERWVSYTSSLLLFIIGFIAHTKLQIIGTRVGNKVNIVWLRVYRLSLPIA